jgi:predicted transglutaminase-like cysteine proteinase
MSLFVKAAALVAAVLAVPSVAPQPTTVPIDRVARAKAPHEVGRIVDIVASINAYVNTHMEGESDLEHYGVEELWVMYPADSKGDCEDYALTKLGMLSQLGFPTVAYARIIGVVVHDKYGTDGHAILAIRLPHGTVLYLDNLNAEVMTRKELVRRGYEFFDWRA